MPAYARTAAPVTAGLDEGGKGVLTSTGRSSSPVIRVIYVLKHLGRPLQHRLVAYAPSLGFVMMRKESKIASAQTRERGKNPNRGRMSITMGCKGSERYE